MVDELTYHTCRKRSITAIFGNAGCGKTNWMQHHLRSVPDYDLVIVVCDDSYQHANYYQSCYNIIVLPSLSDAISETLINFLEKQPQACEINKIAFVFDQRNSQIGVIPMSLQNNYLYHMFTFYITNEPMSISKSMRSNIRHYVLFSSSLWNMCPELKKLTQLKSYLSTLKGPSQALLVNTRLFNIDDDANSGYYCQHVPCVQQYRSLPKFNTLSRSIPLDGSENSLSTIVPAMMKADGLEVHYTPITTSIIHMKDKCENTTSTCTNLSTIIPPQPSGAICALQALTNTLLTDMTTSFQCEKVSMGDKSIYHALFILTHKHTHQVVVYTSVALTQNEAEQTISIKVLKKMGEWM